MNLVIVESPAKGQTIEKYLGSGYKVLASFGHVRDLPEKKLGIDTKDFSPEYVIPAKSRKTIKNLKEAAKKAKTVYLATDLDREGEAISWHIAQALGLADEQGKPKKDYKRIVFHEITKKAIEKAIASPRLIDIPLVDAQQARRIIDRLVGYKLSPLLWKKIGKGLSAGRVQSVALRLISDREREILGFKSEGYWQIAPFLYKDKPERDFATTLVKIDDRLIQKMGIKDKKDASQIVADLKKANYRVLDVKQSEVFRFPAHPFTTSTLQMEAARKLGFSAKQTMTLAQKLYEDGKITYMRTDSVNLAPEAIGALRKRVVDQYGKDYLPEKPNIYKTKTRGAQEAHEAIRPTDFNLDEASSDPKINRLYQLILKRTLASGMLPAKFEQIDLQIEAQAKKVYQLKTRGLKQLFDGFMRVYIEGRDEEDEEKDQILPNIKVDDRLKLNKIIDEEKFTEPPRRYTEATLVKKLENEGIGRPSTYAPIMSTIRERNYVIIENRYFKPTEIGLMVNDLLVENFPDIVDLKFTAKIEEDFDQIAENKKSFQPVVKDFYLPFAKNLKEKEKEIDKKDILGTLDEKCPECSSPLVYRMSRFGKFIACSNYPDCRYSRPLEDKETEKKEKEILKDAPNCPKCGHQMELKRGRFGEFLACSNYPECKTTMAIPTGVKCPECKKGDIVSRRSKKGRIFWGCSRYPDCKYATWENPEKNIKEG
jgi:DNA topoisomerase-1